MEFISLRPRARHPGDEAQKQSLRELAACNFSSTHTAVCQFVSARAIFTVNYSNFGISYSNRKAQRSDHRISLKIRFLLNSGRKCVRNARWISNIMIFSSFYCVKNQPNLFKGRNMIKMFHFDVFKLQENQIRLQLIASSVGLNPQPFRKFASFVCIHVLWINFSVHESQTRGICNGFSLSYSLWASLRMRNENSHRREMKSDKDFAR